MVQFLAVSCFLYFCAMALDILALYEIFFPCNCTEVTKDSKIIGNLSDICISGAKIGGVCFWNPGAGNGSLFSAYPREIEAIRTIVERFRYRFERARTCEPGEARPQ